MKIGTVTSGMVIFSTSSLFVQMSGVFRTFADYTTGKIESGIHSFKKSELIDSDWMRRLYWLGTFQPICNIHTYESSIQKLSKTGNIAIPLMFNRYLRSLISIT